MDLDKHDFFTFQGLSTDGNANANKKQMLDKGQNTNDDYNSQLSDSSTEMSSSNIKNEIITSKENKKLNNSTSTTNALLSSSDNLKNAENYRTSSEPSISNVSSSALSSNSKFIIIGMVFKS